MVSSGGAGFCSQAALSVLALSSRFDGHNALGYMRVTTSLSVLALSSRFDGLPLAGCCPVALNSFQYSLCRVVLMVALRRCRLRWMMALSVLALSSRFDGLFRSYVSRSRV